MQIPLVWFVLMWRGVGEIVSLRDLDPTLARYLMIQDEKLAPLRFLFDIYKPRFYFFEVVEW